MKQVIVVRYGEIALKGRNRSFFIDLLVDNIRQSLSHFETTKVKKIQGRIIIKLEKRELASAIDRVRRVFGIVSISPAIVIDSEMAIIEKNMLTMIGQIHENQRAERINSFRITAKRSNKDFPLKSPEIDQCLGQAVLNRYDHWTVDLDHPDLNVWVEVRKKTYLYHQFIAGKGGLPLGSSGKASLLLSGGIDSPIAGYLMARRGLQLNGIYFHSFPYTSDRAKQKVIDLAKIMTCYCGKMKLFVVSFTEIQKKIVELCPPRLRTVIMRRYMLRMAEIIANNEKAKALITGESLGQVASQTMEALAATNAVTELPIFRPLIGFDKDEIVKIAREIGTFETSILPYEDCCALFAAKHPETRPRITPILRAEALISEIMNEMMAKTLETIEIIEC